MTNKNNEYNKIVVTIMIIIMKVIIKLCPKNMLKINSLISLAMN